MAPEGQEPIRFRPHHFLCTVGYEGKGYSPEFVANYDGIARQLRSSRNGDETPITVVGETDSICAACPSKKGTKCDTQTTIEALDNAHAHVLGIRPGQTFTWGEAKKKIKERFTLEKFHSACGPCRWKAYGMCERALTQLTTLAVSFLFLTAPLHASPVPAPSYKTWEDVAAAPAAPIEQVLAKELAAEKAAPAARSLARASKFLLEKKPAEARRLAQQALAHPLLTDVAQAISADATLVLADQYCEKKRHADCLREARSSAAAWADITAHKPYSPAIQRAEQELGTAEALAAHALSRLKRDREAVTLFQSALQRLQRSNALGTLRLEPMKSFLRSCRAHPDLSCRSWVQRLIAVSAKGSPEALAIAESFPDQVSQYKASWSGTRLSQTYRATAPDQVAFEEAFKLYLEERYSKSARQFQAFLDEYPRSKQRGRARFWLAQSLSQENEHDSAQKIYETLIRESPFTFHALAASTVSGISLESYINATLPNAVPLDRNLPPFDLVRMRRALLLARAGATDLASQELREIKSRDRLSNEFLYFLSRMANHVGAHLTAFGALSEMIDRGTESVYSTDGMRLVFPVAYYDLIKRHAEAVGLDPILALCLMKQESAFEAGISSSVGAQGLMQIMPATATETEPTVERALLAEPDTNIRVGTKYLKKMLDRFNGNIAFALASYNAGPNAVDRWIRENRAKQGLIEFIEQIPYPETQNYVGSILRNYYWYSKILGVEPPKDLTRFWRSMDEMLPPPAASPGTTE